MTLKTSRLALSGGAAIVAVLLLWLMFRPTPVQVELATVDYQPFQLTVEDQGRTRARNPFIVAAPITGRLLRTTLLEGDRVREGQVIARIALAPQDQRTRAVAQANLSAAEARRMAAEALLTEYRSSLARSLRELERREELFKVNATTSEELESFRQAADTAEARVNSGEAALRAAEAEVASARSVLFGADVDNPLSEEGVQDVRAPADGTVYRVLEENERVVQAGTPLYAISNRDNIEIVVDLLTQDAVKVAAGNPVLITGWGGVDTLQARVRYIEPEAFTKVSALGVEEQRVNVVADLIDAPANLGAEYRVEVAIVVWQSERELVIPSSAIFQREGGWSTFVADQGRARLRPIQIGHRTQALTQLVSGAAAGEQVLLYPSEQISDGVTIRAME